MKGTHLPAGMTGWRLGSLAKLLKLDYHGDPDQIVRGIGTLQTAGDDQLSFLANPFYQRYLDNTKAAVVILAPDMQQHYQGNMLVSHNPYLSYARFAELYSSKIVASRHTSGIHPTAYIDPDARVASETVIGPNVVIGADVEVAAGCIIEAGSVLEGPSVIAENCHLMARVWVGAGTQLGTRAIVHPGACLGSDGFGLAWEGSKWQKVKQLGGLCIGPDCEIGANTTIDRGSIDNTVLEADVKLDNQIQIAHNVCIGAHTAIAACTGIAGSTTIGSNCLIGGGCGVGGHLTISDGIELTGMSMVTRSLSKAGRYGSAIPAEPEKVWHRNIVRLRQLDRHWQRLITNKQRK